MRPFTIIDSPLPWANGVAGKGGYFWVRSGNLVLNVNPTDIILMARNWRKTR
jgi:hypothetical protein